MTFAIMLSPRVRGSPDPSLTMDFTVVALIISEVKARASFVRSYFSFLKGPLIFVHFPLG